MLIYKYTFNPKITFTVGLFRPWFGIEETYPIDVLQSLEWDKNRINNNDHSKQYSSRLVSGLSQINFTLCK